MWTRGWGKQQVLARTGAESGIDYGTGMMVKVGPNQCDYVERIKDSIYLGCLSVQQHFQDVVPETQIIHVFHGR
jgi:hypothetical protein